MVAVVTWTTSVFLQAGTHHVFAVFVECCLHKEGSQGKAQRVIGVHYTGLPAGGAGLQQTKSQWKKHTGSQGWTEEEMKKPFKTKQLIVHQIKTSILKSREKVLEPVSPNQNHQCNHMIVKAVKWTRFGNILLVFTEQNKLQTRKPGQGWSSKDMKEEMVQYIHIQYIFTYIFCMCVYIYIFS